eukprot:TRINITY_DN103058_c0_g1_i1.p1 TRINITY_DN103058_c0_g1~~TRINITY_DN103058_c0_g1_i1.p1  ORF type:complete len:581 (+),score=116.58 TRINITY_DN103058_c0_g1_i1:224-1744(+)
MPASAFNDFYKWTMCPVTMAVHKARTGGVRCTFSVNVRDTAYRKALYDSARGEASSQLLDLLSQELSSLTARVFDRDRFASLVADKNLVGWGDELLDFVCGPKDSPRKLADEVRLDPSASGPSAAKNPDDVLVEIFVAKDSKLNEERVYIEATGPWPRVTWLETSMMQCVYAALFRDKNRRKYDDPSDAWYSKWLADAFVRCCRSAAAANMSGLKGSLFTGRRTGGMALIMLQCMYCQKALSESCLGTSSVTAHYWLKEAGVDDALIPAPAGTHAHELSMTLSAVLGEVDDRVGMPLSQVVGHMAYFFLSCPNGDVQDARRKALMPMLPDTLGTAAFMEVADLLTVPWGPHKGQPVLSVIGAARQDSGTLKDFRDLMAKYKFDGALMASEIESADDMVTAFKLGYKLYGAGGFFGDSEHAWDKATKNISMAVKVLRVHVNGELSAYYPVKTGDDATGSKFEADGTLDDEALARLRARTDLIKQAKPLLDQCQIQKLFEEVLSNITG